ncbi:hypothetical protein M5K25_015015 [Dendrobium thyrsiflorum]|uniref:Uncharacterized protein n=1 Tax=Dendrobium thyrsiflorum TaxID=117978 RepID=A0ABD0UPV1_DENTH
MPLRVRGRRRKRSPEPFARRAHSCGDRLVSPLFDRGQPRSRTSYEQRAPQPALVDLRDSPTLDSVGLDIVPTCPDILQHCQRDISKEQIELLGIKAELRALGQRKRALLVRRQEIRAVAPY